MPEISQGIHYCCLIVMMCGHSNDIVEPENWLALLSGALYMLTKKEGDEGIIPI